MIKISYLALLLLVTSVTANAQLGKGQWIVGGIAHFSHSGTDGNNNGVDSEIKSTNFDGSAGGGYFIRDRFCAGLRIGRTSEHTKQIINARNTPPLSSYYSSDTKTRGMDFSPFFRYYILKQAHKINFFADASYTYSDVSQTAKTYQEVWYPGSQFPTISNSRMENKYKAHSGSIAAGPAFFLNQKVSLELSIGYRFTKYEKSDLSGNDVVLGAGFQVHLGKN